MMISLAATIARADDCRSPVTVTKAIVEISQGFTGFQGSQNIPAFLQASLPVSEDHRGAIVFNKRDGKWAAFLPMDGETAVGTYVLSPATVLVLTMITSEGPGGGWTLFRSDDGLRTGRCTSIVFPELLNKPTYNNEYLELRYFSMQPSGRGEIVGSALIQRGSKDRTLWFRYTTIDGGRTWSRPVRLSGRPAMPRSTAKPVAKRDIPTLHKSLVDSVSASPSANSTTRP